MLWMTAMFLSSCGFINAPHGALPDSFLQVPAAPVTITNDTAPILVALSYPAKIEPRAEALMHQLYLEGHFAHLRTPLDDDEVNPQALPDALRKTTYYVHELYRALAQRLPKDAILLLPATIDEQAGQLLYRVDDHGLPAAVRVDFMAYRSPYEVNGFTTAGTHGKYVATLLEVRTAPHAAKTTTGVLAANDRLPLLTPQDTAGHPAVLLAIAALAQKREGLKLPVATTLPVPRDTVLGIPFVEYHIPDDDWQAHIAGPGPNRPIMASQHFAGLAHAIVDTLTRVDIASATQEVRSQYVRLYDPDLPTLPDGPARQRRLRVLKEFERVEAQLVSQSSVAPLQHAFDNEWGASMRKVIEAEHTALKKFTQAGWMQALMGLATMGVAGPAAWSPLAAKIQLDQTAAQFQNQMTNIFSALQAEQLHIVVQMGEDSATISGRSLAEVREQLHALYKQRFGPN
jgi:hypothetical protein